ncbi:hypothetical protein NI17_006645 [Thermobifida halotolerans]|uniref:Uncharacterized protein n=1 Tax=Thermobifida halotolerans TaxID=483545 RepID=A0A399G3U0_9ACTN|nr:hypothetical protein [Thermobifida halotolerans]UOE20854.1 hypothetical protein NI17_006645 [Thermobifida halotolerans]
MRGGEGLLKDLKGQEKKFAETRKRLKETLESVDRMINEKVLAEERRSMSTARAFSAYEEVLHNQGDVERATRMVEGILGQAERIVNEQLAPAGTDPVDLVGMVSTYRESYEEWIQAVRSTNEYRAEIGEISTSIDGVREELARLRGEARPELAALYEQSRQELDNEYFRGISRESLGQESLRRLLGQEPDQRRQVGPGRQTREDRSRGR